MAKEKLQQKRSEKQTTSDLYSGVRSVSQSPGRELSPASGRRLQSEEDQKGR